MRLENVNDFATLNSREMHYSRVNANSKCVSSLKAHPHGDFLAQLTRVIPLVRCECS